MCSQCATHEDIEEFLEVAEDMLDTFPPLNMTLSFERDVSMLQVGQAGARY